MKKILLVGYSGHGKITAEAALSMGFDIAGYFELVQQDDNPFNLRYFGPESEEQIREMSKNHVFVVGIGENQLRKKTASQILASGGEVVSVVHTKSHVSPTAELQNGVLVGANATVCTSARIASGAIINTASVIEHDCEIGAFAHIAPGAVLAGGVKVGSGAFVGANAVIKQGVTIGDNAVVGAGAVVLQDLHGGSVYVGNPAKQIR